MLARNEVIKNIVIWLENGNEADRFYAVKTLASLGASQAGEAIMQLLGDEDDDVCIEAALALGELNYTQATPLLKQAIHSHDFGDVKIAATQALSKIATPEAIEILTELITNKPENLDDNNLEVWDDFWDIQLAAVVAMGDNKVATGVPHLIKLLVSDEYQDIELEVLIALAKIGEKGTDYLIENLASTSLRSARRIITALSYVDQKDVDKCLMVLTPMLQHSDKDIRMATCKTLGTYANTQVITELMHRFIDPDTEVAETAIRAVINIAQTIPEGLASISPHMLISLAKDADLNSCKALLKIAEEMSEYGNAMTDKDHHFLQTKLLADNEELIVLSAKLLFLEENNKYLPALVLQISNQELAVHVRRDLIHCYSRHMLNNSADIEPLLLLLEEDNNIIRTTAIELIAKKASLPFSEDINAAELVLYKEVVNAQTEDDEVETNKLATTSTHHSRWAEQAIPVQIVGDAPEQSNVDESCNSTLDALMQNAKQNINIENAEDPREIIEEVEATSTLSAMGVNDNNDSRSPNKIQPEQNSSTDDQDGYLRNLLSEQPDDMQAFNDIIEGNLQNGEQLGYSRKKIVKIKKIETQILAAKALAFYPVKSTIDLILASLREPNAELTIALLSALERIVVEKHRIKDLTNVVGICSTLIFAGNKEIQRLAASITGELQHRKAIPALHHAINCKDQNVRIQAINSLAKLTSERALKVSKQQVDVNNESTDEKTIRLVIECLDDSEYGVRKAAIAFIDQHNIVLHEKLIDAGCADGGALAKVVGIALRNMDEHLVSNVLIDKLNNSSEFSQRRYLFQQVESLFKKV